MIVSDSDKNKIIARYRHSLTTILLIFRLILRLILGLMVGIDGPSVFRPTIISSGGEKPTTIIPWGRE